MIESMEARIAPAAVFTFTDVDGDRVTIKSSVGTKELLAAAVDLEQLGNGRAQLMELKLGAQFTGAKITILAATPAKLQGADGFVDVGRIDATGVDLKSVVVDGDLGSI